MKKSLACLGFIFVCLIILSTSVPASAARNVKSGPVGCSAMDANGGTALGTASEVITDSTNGNAVFVCKFTVIPPGEAITFDAYNNPNYTAYPEDGPSHCSDDTGALSTLDWHETISASGEGTMVCHFSV